LDRFRVAPEPGLVVEQNERNNFAIGYVSLASVHIIAVTGDCDGDGTVTFGELYDVFLWYANDEIPEDPDVRHRVDTNGNGRVDFGELYDAFLNYAKG